MTGIRTAAALAIAALFAMPAYAQTAPAPQRTITVPAIPVSVDRAYPGGTMLLDIDASDVARGAYRVTQTIPLSSASPAASPRRITLLFPEWLPGNHGPRGPIAELVDLRLTVDGKAVSWRRDPYEVHAFHVDLPAGARSLVARFIHTSPLRSSEGRVTMTREMLNLQWEKMSLYPAGHFVRRIRVKPRVTLPPGWRAATALPGQSRSGNTVSWAETDFETLVDSPIFAGAYYRQWPLGNSAHLHAVADAPGLLTLREDDQKRFSALFTEALLTFGKAPYDRYDFLVALTDRLGRIGLEHLKSSENQLEPRNFIAWSDFDWDRNVLAHELVHSWNGKFRRPVGLWTPDYRTPMRDDLLWVYEGQTHFWGWVLSARSGLQSPGMVLGMMASAAGYQAENPGREWRSVADTTLDPLVAARKARPFRSLARGEDYYHEGALIWLEADQIIRKGTGGSKGLDDFARRFFAHPGGDVRVSLFDFDDLVAALNTTYAYDWAGFLRARIDERGRPAPVAGIEMAGYRLVWKDRPNPYARARMDHSRNLSLYHSLGLTLDHDGRVSATRWNGPAFQAGIVTGSRILAVGGLAFTPELLQQAIAAAQKARKPVEILVRRGDRFRTVSVAYYDGLRWPWLERANGRKVTALDQLLAPRRK